MDYNFPKVQLKCNNKIKKSNNYKNQEMIIIDCISNLLFKLNVKNLIIAFGGSGQGGGGSGEYFVLIEK